MMPAYCLKLTTCFGTQHHRALCLVAQQVNTSVGVLQPLPKPSKVSESPYDLSVTVFVLWKLGLCCDFV